MNSNVHIPNREDNQANILAFIDEFHAQVWKFYSNLYHIDPNAAFSEFHNTYCNLLIKFCRIKNKLKTLNFNLENLGYLMV